MTVIPSSLADQISADKDADVFVSDFDNRMVRYPTHFVDIRLGSHLFGNVEVIASESDTAYLGLDVLNQLKLLLDGPKNMLTIY